MSKKFLGLAFPALVVAVAFFIGVSIAHIQTAQAAEIEAVPTQDNALILNSNQIDMATAPVKSASISGGTSCSYCRYQYMVTGDYNQYVSCLYSPPCT